MANEDYIFCNFLSGHPGLELILEFDEQFVVTILAQQAWDLMIWFDILQAE